MLDSTEIGMRRCMLESGAQLLLGEVVAFGEEVSHSPALVYCANDPPLLPNRRPLTTTAQGRQSSRVGKSQAVAIARHSALRIIGAVREAHNNAILRGHLPLARGKDGAAARVCCWVWQVSTLASWTSIADTSWFGCQVFLGDPYGGDSQDNPSIIHTDFGDFQGFKWCVGPRHPTTSLVSFLK